MKKTYEAPEAKFIGFAPAENLANASWDWSLKYAAETEIDGSDSQVDIVYPTNPEGNFRRR